MSSEMTAPVQMALLKVGELMEQYLAEVAADTCVQPSKFLVLALSLPEYMRQLGDGLYRAVDLYLEALNYHKLGAETCKSAAHNPRFSPSLGIQIALVQQNQLKTTTSEGSYRIGGSCSPIKNTSSRVGQQTSGIYDAVLYVRHMPCNGKRSQLQSLERLTRSTWPDWLLCSF